MLLGNLIHTSSAEKNHTDLIDPDYLFAELRLLLFIVRLCMYPDPHEFQCVPDETQASSVANLLDACYCIYKKIQLTPCRKAMGQKF